MSPKSKLRWIVAAVLIAFIIPLATTPYTYAQSPTDADPQITWNDAPNPLTVRHIGEWLYSNGWYENSEIFGPFKEDTGDTEFEVGDEAEFSLAMAEFDDTKYPFVLRYKSDSAYFWFPPNYPVDETALATAAAYFDDVIQPSVRAVFGDESLPGIDNDRRLHIVHQEYIGYGAVGVFRPSDQCPIFLCEESNQRDIIYYSLDWGDVNSQEHLTTLAHEFQHVIRYNQDGNERRWMNEGMSQLAEHLGGFSPENVVGDNLIAYLDHPDQRLDGWADITADPSIYYGSSFLYLVYLYERFGLNFIRQLAASPYDGLAAVYHTLADLEPDTTMDAVFADWLVANYLDNPYVAQGQYYYSTLRDSIQVHTEVLSLIPPNQQTYNSDINQYGANYFSLDEGVYELVFDGSDQTPFVNDVHPHSGAWMWWATDAVNSVARLTREVDLREVDEAALQFALWYDIEDDYDWFDVMVSVDGGTIWKPIGNTHMRPSSEMIPVPHFTGRSQGWVEEKFDLTPFAGKEILLRLEYVTDGNLSYRGVLLDDLTIPEVGFVDDVEQPLDNWLTEGFVRVPETVSQNWTVAFIANDDLPTVEFLSLSPDNIGNATLQAPAGGGVLVIGAMAPLTPEKARYKMVIAAVD